MPGLRRLRSRRQIQNASFAAARRGTFTVVVKPKSYLLKWAGKRCYHRTSVMFGYVLFLGSSACKLTPCLCVPLHAPVLLVSVSWASSSPTRDTSFSRTCQRLLCAATQEIPGFAPRARYVVLLWSTSVSPWLDEFTGVELGGG